MHKKVTTSFLLA